MKEENDIRRSHKETETIIEPPMPLKRILKELSNATRSEVATHTDQHANNVDNRGNHHDSHVNHGGND
jgi:hypothetical protein